MRGVIITLLAVGGIVLGAGIDEYAVYPTRAMTLGGAYSAVGEGAEAVFVNPAGIHTDSRLDLSANYSPMYGVDGLFAYSTSVAFGTFLGAMGFGWTRVGLADVYSQNLLVWRSATVIKPDLFMGAGIKFFVVSAPGYEKYGDTSFSTNDAALTGDFGLLWRPREKMSLAFVGENLVESEISLFGSGGDWLRRRFMFGAAYQPQKFLLFSAQLNTHDFTDISVDLGTEVTFFNAIALRSGFHRGRLTMGAGIFSKRWRFDVGLFSHRVLGNNYQFSLKFSF